MGTNASFDPQDTCPEPMTRAELLALRAAGELDIQCHYIVTDGPVIGTTGNTSPTRILMHAVSATELSTNVHVDTLFTPTAQVWPGGYDIDLGTQGSLFKLTDDFNNEVTDSDPDAPTVHVQFPWHLRGTGLRDNRVDDCTLTGWDTAVAAGVLVWDNKLLHAGVHLSGMVDGTFSRNDIQGPQVTVGAPNVLFNSNVIHNAPVTFSGSNAGVQSFQANTLLSGLVDVDSSTTGPVDMNENVIGGEGITGYRIIVTAATGSVDISGNRLFNQGPSLTHELRATGAGPVVVSSNEFGAGTVDINSASAVTIVASALVEPTLSVTTGTDIHALRVSNATVNVSGTTGSSILDTDVIGSTLNLSGPGGLSNGRMLGTTLTSGGFTMDVFDIVGGTKTLTANQSDRLRNASFTNLV
ncbi:hypothetical protein SEA_XKCD426_20 [Streptomyces phage Xkcd426]|nr:hypothetical protein SEA_XKCD426_20 [Streptomyces phage Xkcd426]